MQNIAAQRRVQRPLVQFWRSTVATLLLWLLEATAASEVPDTAPLMSLPGETLDAFMLRIAPPYVATSLATTFEVCGVLGELEGTYALVIQRTGGNGFCRIDLAAIPDGYASTGLTFHTHSTRDDFKFSDADYANPGYLATYEGVRFQNGRGTDRVVGRFTGLQRAIILRR